MSDDLRERIAQELHDQPLQAAIACSIRLQMLDDRIDDPTLRQHLADAAEAAGETITALRSLIDALQSEPGHSGGGQSPDRSG